MKAKIALRDRKWDEAERLASEMVADPARGARWQSEGLEVVASVRAAKGRVQEAVAALHQLIDTNHESGRAEGHRAGQLSLLILTEVADLDPAAWRLEILQADTTEQTRAISGLWAADLGDTALARAYRDGLPDSALGEFDRPDAQDALLATLDARLAGLTGDWDSAVRLLEPVTGGRSPRPGGVAAQLPRWFVATAEEALGRRDSAARYFSDLAAGYRLAFAEVLKFGLTYSFAHRRAAILYSQLGQNDLAMDHWRAFLDAFTQPDPDFEWMVEEARAELARLGG